MPDRLAMDASAGQAAARTTISQLPLEVSGLIWSAGGKRIIDGIVLQLGDGGVTVIMGPNGAGKSLLIRLLHGLLEPEAGEITWNGQRAGEGTRAQQAMVFQKPVLLRRSVAANIDFVLKLKGGGEPGYRDELLARAGLADKARQPARALSGGEQQRLAMVRALATRPQVLLLDEPTASLDPASVHMIETMIAEVRKAGVKVVLVTHDAGQARRLAHDVVFLHRGRVAEHTTAARFFDKPISAPARDYLAGKIVL
jgi:tungstate transport system ATP-binding protein